VGSATTEWRGKYTPVRFSVPIRAESNWSENWMWIRVQPVLYLYQCTISVQVPMVLAPLPHRTRSCYLSSYPLNLRSAPLCGIMSMAKRIKGVLSSVTQNQFPIPLQASHILLFWFAQHSTLMSKSQYHLEYAAWTLKAEQSKSLLGSNRSVPQYGAVPQGSDSSLLENKKTIGFWSAVFIIFNRIIGTGYA